MFNKDTGEIIESDCPEKHPPKFQTVFGRTLVELAELNPLIMGITPAMPTGSSLNIMISKMPYRAFDVGIAEQHAVTFSAGLAAQGMIPFCNIYSSFMQRAYDQVIHDVALQNLHVILCLDRGGLVGEDGATHHGAYDLAYFRAIPNLVICSPLNEQELRNMMYTAQLPRKGPVVIRYPRGRGSMVDWKTPFEPVEIGKGQLLREGSDLAIITLGPIGIDALNAARLMQEKGIRVTVANMRFLKPIDEALLHQLLAGHRKVITVEDGTILGGLGSAVMEFAADHSYEPEIRRLGIPDRFIEQGTPEELRRECGFDTEGILETALAMMKE